LCAIAACIVVRAPTIFEEGQIPIIDVRLKLNAGYVLVFGPLLILCGIAAITYLRSSPAAKEDRFAGVLARAIPCLAAAFLSLQFFLLFAPNGQCNIFSRWRYLADWKLSAFKPEYCMSLPAETQERMPWLFDPPIVQAWAQVLLPFLALFLAVKDWRSVHRSRIITFEL
jgi:hypothetical protein